ncbi:hypothetical protein QF001_000936 [Paraburkholderia youngii]|uniref:phage baseplate protein n=1 Tax=Paraburkholderia youngii TaxID=2782701 RepID=UPI003D19DDF9
MSGFLQTGIGLAASVAGGAIVQAFFSPSRSINSSIGSFSLYVTIEEHHHDELVITDHPVEQGAAISDHAYKKPSELTMTIGWTNSSLASIGTFQFGNYSSSTYKDLLALQKQRVPFDISTGKRKYRNMLIQSLDTTTDAKTENSLIVTLHCREVIIVQTTTTQLQPAGNMASPQKTAETANTGTKQPQATTTSVLYRTFN